MKKIVLSGVLMLVGTLAFAKTGEVKVKDFSFCKVYCERSYIDDDGYTHSYVTKAGSLFTSCEKASEKCEDKLDKMNIPE